MTYQELRAHAAFLMLVVAAWTPATDVAVAQKRTQKPVRAKAPDLSKGAFEGVFFDDPKSLLKGDLPREQAAVMTQPKVGDASANGGSAPSEADDDAMAWKNLVSPASLEDLVKGAKLNLDRIITSRAAFASGGFIEARNEFSLLALLFAIIENYPDDVRWKQSAALARERLTRAAANTKVGSVQTFDEAKKRLLDLGDLVNGSQLVGEAREDLDWGNLIDRVPLMRLLERAEQEHISKYSASEKEFNDHLDELRMYAQMVSILGKAALHEDMPDAVDDDYIGYTNDMISHAKSVVTAVETGNAELARSAAGKLGQSCTICHDDFR